MDIEEEAGVKEENDLSKYIYKHETEIICEIPVPPITDEYVEDYPPMVERYFTRYYYIKPGNKFEPYMVLIHSNRVCLVCLAPEHALFTSGVASFTYNIGNMDRSKNQVKGKGKKGGMALQADSSLALATGNDGVSYKIPSCVRGKLIEVNTALSENPSLLITAEEGAGYVAIILPKPEHCDEIQRHLLTQEQYRTRIAELSTEAPGTSEAME